MHCTAGADGLQANDVGVARDPGEVRSTTARRRVSGTNPEKQFGKRNRVGNGTETAG